MSVSNTLRTPWKVEPTDRWPGLFDVYDYDGNVIAAAKIEEVARLIAAAPELLAALEALAAEPSDCWRDATDDDDGHTRTPRQRMLKQARAAIAKATEED